MTFGFQRNDDTIQAQCPNCGKFPSEDDGFYAWVEGEPDGISLFCNMPCAVSFEEKGGHFTDGDGVRYKLGEPS